MRTAFKNIAYAVPFRERKSEYFTPETSIGFFSLKTGNGIVSSGKVKNKNWYSPSQLIPVVGTTFVSHGSYTASSVEIATSPIFEGIGKSIVLRCYVQQFDVYRNKMKYSWAATTSNANRSNYIDFGERGIDDAYQVGFGNFDCPYDYKQGNTSGKYREFKLDCFKEFNSGNPLYIYLFPRFEQSADNVHIGSHTTGSSAQGTAVVDKTFDTFVSFGYMA